MRGVVAVMSGNQHEPGKFRVREFAMTSFSAVHARESGIGNVTNELSDLSRHAAKKSEFAPVFQSGSDKR
jgi:hypothetical protein